MCYCWNSCAPFKQFMCLQLVIASCPFWKKYVFLSPILGMSLSAGSSPLHSPKITPHTSPAPRRRSHTPNPANYMVPTTASDPGTHIIQKETVGGTTYFYTDNTPAPMAGMVRSGNICRLYLGTQLEVLSSNQPLKDALVHSDFCSRAAANDYFHYQFFSQENGCAQEYHI